MKKQLKSLFVVALLAITTLPVWGQASTLGKEFWVSSTIVCSPSNGKGINPYIAISAEKACTVKIQGGENNAINITQQVASGSWNEFGNGSTSQTDPTKGMIKVPMDPSKWYPVNTKEPATVCNLAGKKYMYGLHITATENISVYVILGGESSSDASNILPLTALGTEYYVQDYQSEAHNNKSWSTNEGNMVTMTTILGTEDGTKVDITPNGDTYDGWVSGTTHQITINKGQTYYLMSKKEKQLSGTHIAADHKIAVYTGSPLTRLPNGLSARDALFEQSMPVEYWGTKFIATRSLGKNGNIIGITAMTNGTEVKIDGYTQTNLREGETYYILLQNATDPYSKRSSSITSRIDQVITGDVMYIETSCPCAVYNYDTGNGLKYDDNSTEIVSGQGGDPSSVWVSPVQQMINKITFGTCYTDNTKNHFLNVVTETATCQNTKLTALYGAQQLDKSSSLIWAPVPGNPKYSYARAKIGDSSTSQFSVFRLENPKGVIAIVYGNGNDESYAYSAGSAAVEQGVIVNGETFVNGYRSDSKFCMDSLLSFDSKVGTDEITRVDWDFGDGTSLINGEPTAQHEYTSAGWYDVKADLYGHQVCTSENDQFIGTVQFSFRVVEPVYQFRNIVNKCMREGDPDFDKLGTSVLDTAWNEAASCGDTIWIDYIQYGMITDSVDVIKARDTYYEPINGVTYPLDPDDPEAYSIDLEFDLKELKIQSNEYDCPIILKRHIDIVTCVDMEIPNTTHHACHKDNYMPVTYLLNKGARSMGEVSATINGQTVPVSIDKYAIYLPVGDLTPGYYAATIHVEDTVCNQTLDFPIDYVVYYSDSIFAYKFNNVLAVYNPGYGGNAELRTEFVAYQWYVNGQKIEGATESIYHQDTPFRAGDNGDEVYVVLTDKSGMTLQSCPLKIPNSPDYTPTPKGMPARKYLRNNHFVIEIGDKQYDIYGQRKR